MLFFVRPPPPLKRYRPRQKSQAGSGGCAFQNRDLVSFERGFVSNSLFSLSEPPSGLKNLAIIRFSLFFFIVSSYLLSLYHSLARFFCLLFGNRRKATTNFTIGRGEKEQRKKEKTIKTGSTFETGTSNILAARKYEEGEGNLHQNSKHPNVLCSSFLFKDSLFLAKVTTAQTVIETSRCLREKTAPSRRLRRTTA